MNKLTPLALVTAAALALAACGGDSNRNVEDAFVTQVRALLNDMSENTEPSQAAFDRVIASTPETTEPSPL